MADRATLDDLVDEAAIKRVQLRYCRGIDRHDWELVRTCFKPGSHHHIGPFRGAAEELVPWLAQTMTSFSSTVHFSGNQLVEIHGDDAWAEQYVRACHRIASTAEVREREWIVDLRYVDMFERTNDVWRIARRILITDSVREDAPDMTKSDDGWLMGDRFPHDRSYPMTEPTEFTIADY
jgi:hypothetical protein